MPRGHVRYFVGHDSRQFRLLLRAKNQPAIYVKESTWQRKRIDLVGIDHLDRKRHPRIRIAHEVLTDAVYVLRDDRVVDKLRRPLDVLRQLLAKRNFLFQRIEVGAPTHLSIADRLDIVFRIPRVYGVLLLDGLLLPVLWLLRSILRFRRVWRWRRTLREGGTQCQRAQDDWSHHSSQDSLHRIHLGLYGRFPSQCLQTMRCACRDEVSKSGRPRSSCLGARYVVASPPFGSCVNKFIWAACSELSRVGSGTFRHAANLINRAAGIGASSILLQYENLFCLHRCHESVLDRGSQQNSKCSPIPWS